MRPEAHNGELERKLALLGLDIGRYTPALAHGFLARWPHPSDWNTLEAQSALISTFAIGETTFMRHAEHFNALRSVLPELCHARKGSPLRAFSAGCSSGEEAYSLAATLSSCVGLAFELFAWDVNPEAIVRAKQAEYRPWSLRGVDVHTTSGWLEPAPCGVKVQPWLQKRVAFQIGNLYLDALPGDLDIIFCRNVLLYFRPDAAAYVIERLMQSLRPGGVLFLGHYDPRPGPGMGLTQRSVEHTTFYQRPVSNERSYSSLRAPSLLRPSLHPGTVAREDALPRAGLGDRMQRVRQLASDHRTDDALTLLSQIQETTPLLPDVHVLTALVAEEAGDMRLMLEASRRACFLVPDQPGPNYLLSVAFVRNGELRRAALHRRIAAAGLKGLTSPMTVVDFSEGLTVGQLRRLIGAIAR
jgi:chemotaxis protein methyltransferase CheR